MSILIVVTYYRPHVSGLTLYVQRLAQGLAERGHRVTVLASQHSPELPTEEWIHGVRVVRVPVAFRIGKGPVMPGFPAALWRLARGHDIMSVHLPQLEGGLAGVVGRLTGTPTFLTYHCDLQLPPGPLSRIIDEVVFGSNYLAAALSNKIVAYTLDYARHSRLLKRFLNKVEVIPPPVVIAPVAPDERDAIRRRLGLEGQCVVGSATRVATEKGIEFLLEAVEMLSSDLATVHLVHAGQNKDVMGEEQYLQRLEPMIARLADRAVFLGQIPPEEMRVFFSSIDVLVVSSVNSTESFGLVQVEAMLCGTPVVATSLPGVREPIRMTGMGEVVPPRDPGALAAGILKVLRNREKYQRTREEIVAIFDVDRTLASYERLFRSALP
jgi:glycosyltransferase involved in cell wall biosynthesis